MVIPPQIEPDYEVIKGILPTANPDEYACCIAADMWNACRAAMLNAEKLNQPVSETETLPSEYLQGHQDGLEWAAQMAEANHPQTGDWVYDDPIALAAAIRKGPDMPLASGNSPATPDGWIPVSERMPDPKSEFRVCVYTPTPHEDIRYRFVPAALFKAVCRDATHWYYMTAPAAPKVVGR